MNRKVFFDACRSGVMGPTLDGGEVSGSEAILDAMEGLPISWVAYALATTWHETAHTMQPIKEYGGNAYFHRMYDIEGNRPHIAKQLGNLIPGDGVKFAGRGYVQLTGRTNYARAGKKIGEPLECEPDLAMRPDIAAKVLREGMVEGWFTGRKFSSYLPSEGTAALDSFKAARRIINGTDKAAMIARYAAQFQKALVAAGWGK